MEESHEKVSAIPGAVHKAMCPLQYRKRVRTVQAIRERLPVDALAVAEETPCRAIVW